MDTRDFQNIFADAVLRLRKAKLLTMLEARQERRDFDARISRREIETLVDAERAAQDLKSRLSARRAPRDLPARERVERAFVFPTAANARGFATNYRHDFGAYGMKTSGKKVTFKYHPEDQRVEALEVGALAWGWGERPKRARR
jgi:hypothetical protein